MSVQLVVYLAAMAVVYFYASYRNSFAYLWIVLYFLLAWWVEDNYHGNLSAAYCFVALFFVALCELLVRVGKDPFSEDSIRSTLLGCLKLVGLAPKTALVNVAEHRDVVKAREYIQQRSWNRLEKYIAKVTDDQRFTIYRGLTDTERRPDFIDQWLADHPGSDVAARMSGLSYVSTGWAARGSATADMVSQKGREVFFEHLELAEQDFQRAIGINDNCFVTYIGLMRIAMGAGIGADKIWAYFAKGVALSPHNYQVHSAMIHACAPKWSGDASDMFSVAHKAADEAPGASPVIAGLAVAHAEQWLSLAMMDQEDEAAQYFRQLSVKADLKRVMKAADNWNVVELSAIEALNVLAFCLDRAEMYVEFRSLLGLLNQRYIEYPWCYYHEAFLSGLDSAYALDHVLKKHGQ